MGVDEVADDRQDDVVDQRRDRRVRRAREPELGRVVEAVEQRLRGAGHLQRDQSAHPQPVPRLLLVGGAHHPQPDRVALVDERREALHLVSGAHLS